MLSPPHNAKNQTPHPLQGNRLLELLLGSELVGVTALALAAVGRTRREAGLG